MVFARCGFVVIALSLLLTCPATAQEPASAAVPQVPIAPPPLKVGNHVGDVLDSLLLGGAFQRARDDEVRRMAENYRIQLADFVRALTPKQYEAVLADPTQRSRFIAGVAYLETIRPYLDSVARRDGQGARVGTGVVADAPSDGVRVYSPSQCIGAVVMGVCHGSIMPNGSQPMTCHGQMLNGQCTGPMF